MGNAQPAQPHHPWPPRLTPASPGSPRLRLAPPRAPLLGAAGERVSTGGRRSGMHLRSPCSRPPRVWFLAGSPTSRQRRRLLSHGRDARRIERTQARRCTSAGEAPHEHVCANSAPITDRVEGSIAPSQPPAPSPPSAPERRRKSWTIDVLGRPERERVRWSVHGCKTWRHERAAQRPIDEDIDAGEAAARRTTCARGGGAPRISVRIGDRWARSGVRWR